MTAPLWKGSRFPIQTCISGWAMLNGKAAVIPDIYRDQRIPHSLYRRTFVSAGIGFVRTRAGAGAGVDQLLADADELMYAEKKTNATSRLANGMA